MGEFATNGKANAALTTGIIGTAGFGLNLLGNLMGGAYAANQACGCNQMAYANGCSENHLVNRYELGLEQSNAAKDSEIALLKANIYGDQKLVEVYKYIDGELKDIRANLGTQAVMNQKTADSFEMVRNDMICCKNELYSAINREHDERCCGDNVIVNYANATFYPKMVADVTTGTTTTAQSLYNPLPRCGRCDCG